MNSTIGGVKKAVPKRAVKMDFDAEDNDDIELAPKKAKKEGHSTLDLVQECDMLLMALTEEIEHHAGVIASTLAPEESALLKGEGDPIGLSGLNYAMLSLRRKIVGATEQLKELTSRVQL